VERFLDDTQGVDKIPGWSEWIYRSAAGQKYDHGTTEKPNRSFKDEISTLLDLP
jgi:hypothetical protein